ncbi:chondroitin AC/alginate lyase [Leucogyrophana mollusca]|uniref:Chondroitin AC/alginate lyase n=1 Tax=Leucogyrophana mollusca TaxID=85980 RepID=A0ACB8B7M1_9AGAM|nr:chondroitin AC/alginate lyase [Leucogyrophana mollusca]
MRRVKRLAALDEVPAIPGKSPTASAGRHKQTAFTLYQVGLEPSPEVPILHDPAAQPGPTSPAGGLPANPVLPGSQTSDQVISGTQAPAQDPARTHKPKCTPSNTSLAPSATWTTCPYAVRDGRVNPDVRTLAGVPAINGASQAILYNAIAYALSRDRSYSKNVAAFVDAFFLTPSTRMNPNMNFGQVVRGPGFSGREGTFTGILDLRGIVKIVNGIFIMRGTSAPDWTATRDQGMTTWMTQYIGWLQSSALGEKAASRPNNHGSFFASQLAATQMLTGDVNGATATLEYYFSHQFQDQVAASGEQPFEAVRTRPYHYRCFNLEAMITNAKLGDQLGLDFWTTKSKYGATIQDALDYTMELDPKNENVADIFPHVGAIAAAYGDPDGKYDKFLQERDSAYRSQSFWYYDQTVALPRSPAARGNTRRSAGVENDQTSGSDTSSSFVCPGIFGIAPNRPVEIADGIFVTCDQLKDFYLPRLS